MCRHGSSHSNVIVFSVSLRNLGNRIGSIFEKKKKETAEAAEEQTEKTEDLVEQQLTKASEILRNSQTETETAGI